MGASAVLFAGPPSPAATFETIEKFKPTLYFGVPTLYAAQLAAMEAGKPDLASLRLDYALSPEMTLRTLTQYNSTTDAVSTSVRFNWIYMPGSDLYIAYDELRQDIPGVPWLQNRQLAVKMTYLLSR